MRLYYFVIVLLFFLYYCFVAANLAAMTTTTTTVRRRRRNLATDQSALLAFKAHVDDPLSVLANNWSLSYPICSRWVGVTCGVRRRRVTALNLSSMGLGGTIPPHLGNLSFLQYLHIRYNNFHGHLPSELGQLRRLRYMSFAYNKLSGNFPSWIGILSRLQMVNLTNNSFTGPIPDSLYNLSRLEALDASNNRIGGNIPSRIGNWSQLIYLLWLDGNNLRGEIPKEIGNLQNLENLVLGLNNLSGAIPPSIFNISSMALLSLGGNQLSGHLPSTLGHSLLNLKWLSLASNKLVGTIPNLITNASKLILLDLSFNSFSGLIPNTFGNLRHLSILGLVSNYLTTESSNNNNAEWSFLSSLTNCRNLTVLGLSANPLQGTLPPLIGNFSSSLQKFFAYDCKLKGNIPEEIGNLSGLIILSLHSNVFDGNIPRTVGRLHQLQGLDLHDNNIQGSIPYDICHLKGLGTLVLGGNKLSGHIPQCLENFTSLRQLDLGFNKLTDSIPLSLWNLPYILSIYLSSNSLSGSLSSNIQNLKVLIDFDLSMNQIEGEIPKTIGGLENLATLSLASNKFQGFIPESLGHLISLESLDLSGNNLSGKIPKSLEALTHLKHFNVSDNKLEGKISTKGPFRYFSPQSFLRNYALCGPKKLQVPPCKEDNNKGSKKTAVLIFKYVLPAILFIMVIVVFIILFVRYQKRSTKKPDHEDCLSLASWKRISYFEIQRATDGFNNCNLLGTGSFGSVYKGTLSDGTNIAIKIFNLQLERAFRSFDSECEVLRNVRHRNLLKILSSCSNEDFKALVLEYMPNGSLEKWLYSHEYFLDILERLNIMIDVGLALEYLHHGYSTPIVHCDLKPNNILLDEHMVAHVSDFGISKILGEGEGDDYVTQTITMATIGYMAPEYGSEGIISTKCDVYSYGILLMETFTRKKPTDELFTGEMSLKHWVKESLPHGLTEVVDANLIQEEHAFSAKIDCLSSIIRLALDCCMDSPDDRIHVTDAVVKLKKIQLKFHNDLKL